MRRRAALFLITLAAACGDRDVTRVDPVPTSVDTWSFPARPIRAVDILFVVDNSGSMAGEQASLAAHFPTFMAVLDTIDGGLPDVHIGVVSSNVGAAGQASVPGCAGAGDDGLLQTNGCPGLTDRFLGDVADARGGRIRNYSGDLAEQFACMAQLGTGGCGFEMHLESMYRALQPGKNPGFLRPEALLAVIVIADEDDCSADHGTVFGDPTAGVGSPLGPRTSFRCFEFGVECDDDPDPRAFGVKTGCRPRAASPYLVEVGRYVDFLRTLKADPALVLVAGIVGVDDEHHTVVVGPDPGTPANPAVQKSCFLVDPDDPNDGAAPPIRLGAFLRGFPDRNTSTSICGATMQDALRQIAERVGPALFDPCLRHPLADVDPAQPGLQPECTVTSVRAPFDDDRQEALVPACLDSGGAPPCWELAADAVTCPSAPDHLLIHVVEDPAAPLAGMLEAQCLVQ